MSDHARLEWMTPELEAELKSIARDGCITCEQAQAFAAKHDIPITALKPFADRLGLAVSGCRGLCAP